MKLVISWIFVISRISSRGSSMPYELETKDEKRFLLFLLNSFDGKCDLV